LQFIFTDLTWKAHQTVLYGIHALQASLDAPLRMARPEIAF